MIAEWLLSHLHSLCSESHKFIAPLIRRPSLMASSDLDFINLADLIIYTLPPPVLIDSLNGIRLWRPDAEVIDHRSPFSFDFHPFPPTHDILSIGSCEAPTFGVPKAGARAPLHTLPPVGFIRPVYFESESCDPQETKACTKSVFEGTPKG